MDTLMVNHPVLIIHVGYCIHTSIIMDSPYGHLSIWTVVHMDSHPYVPCIYAYIYMHIWIHNDG